MSLTFQKGAATVGFNMTPMSDVTFQLIIFFILAGQCASQELAKLIPPKLDHSQAQQPEKMPTNRVVVNVPSAAGDEKNANPALASEAKEYQVGTKRINVGDRASLVKEMKRCRGDQKEFYVEIRADYRVRFAAIEPVMLAAAEAEIPKMNITALLAQE